MESAKVCEAIPSAFGEDSKAMMRDTLKDGRERGFFVLKKEEGLARSGVRVGGKRGINITMFNPFNIFGEPIGTIHTHPEAKGDELMSLVDAKMLLDGGFDFVGITFRDRGQEMMALFTDQGFDSFRAAIQDVASRTPRFDHMTDEQKVVTTVREFNRTLEDCEVTL